MSSFSIFTVGSNFSPSLFRWTQVTRCQSLLYAAETLGSASLTSLQLTDQADWSRSGQTWRFDNGSHRFSASLVARAVLRFAEIDLELAKFSECIVIYSIGATRITEFSANLFHFIWLRCLLFLRQMSKAHFTHLPILHSMFDKMRKIDKSW